MEIRRGEAEYHKVCILEPLNLGGEDGGELSRVRNVAVLPFI
jgi:hypothetical protein